MAFSAAGKNQVLTQWNPLPLNASITAGFKRSVGVAVADAKTHSPNTKSSARGRIASDTLAYLIPTGLGTIFEVGRAGGYPIFPTGVQGLRRTSKRGTDYKVGFTSRGLQRHYLGGPGLMHPLADTLGGAMAADPYIKPAAARWAKGGCQLTMTQSLASKGFRRR